MNTCLTCAILLRLNAGADMRHILWWECAALPGRANLKSFPFRSTTCTSWVRQRHMACGIACQYAKALGAAPEHECKRGGCKYDDLQASGS